MIQTIWRLTRNADDTEDVIQDALERIIKVFPKLEKHPNPTAYILRICVNAAHDHLRRKKNWVLLEDQNLTAFNQISLTPTPAESLVWKERIQDVLAAIRRLPKREMEALILLVFEEFTYPEIAQVMGCRESTIRSMIAKARKRLSRWIGESTSLENLEVQES